MASSQYNTLVVLGPTASGKTRLGVRLARAFGGEIVSADSRQVYRGLDLGAGKDRSEYMLDGVPIPYHLIDIVDLDAEFSVFDFQQRFFGVFESLAARGVLPVVVGGTGLYLEAILLGYRMAPVPESPELRLELADLSYDVLVDRLKSVKKCLHNTTDLVSRDRLIRAIEIAEYGRYHDPEPPPDIRPLILGTRWDREVLRARIRERLVERLDAGMIDEVEGLHAQGVPWERLERLGLEYRAISEWLQGKISSRREFVHRLYVAICQFAKRQETWFRRMERNGATIHWVPSADFDAARAIAAGAGL
jgi:tRNA dimethylallyltransferase